MKHLLIATLTLATMSFACKQYTLTAPVTYATELIDSNPVIFDHQLFRPHRTARYEIQMVVCIDSAIAAYKDSVEKKAKKGAK